MSSRARAGASILSAFPDFLLSATFLITWIEPAWFGDGTVRALVLLIVLEFFVMHSSAAMAFGVLAQPTRARRIVATTAFSAFYMLFAGALAVAFTTVWPLAAFAGLTFNRLLPILVGPVPTDREQVLVQEGWLFSFVAYMLAVGLTGLLPVPALGITETVVQYEALPGTGSSVEQPQRAIACGFLYFGAIGAAQLFLDRWLDGPDPDAGPPVVA